MKQVERLFSPKSVAIVGASDDKSRPGGRGIDAMLSYGYKGRILPVHPRLKQPGSALIAGLPAQDLRPITPA